MVGVGVKDINRNWPITTADVHDTQSTRELRTGKREETEWEEEKRRRVPASLWQGDRLEGR